MDYLYSPWGSKELETAERPAHTHMNQQCKRPRLCFLEHLNEFHWFEDYSPTCYV